MMTALQFILLSQLSTFLTNLNGQANDLMTVLIALFARLANLALDFAGALLPPYGGG